MRIMAFFVGFKWLTNATIPGLWAIVLALAHCSFDGKIRIYQEFVMLVPRYSLILITGRTDEDLGSQVA